MAPAIDALSMFSRWTVLSGASLTSSTSLRLSFRWTIAALVSRLSSIPWATDARVLMLHGATTIPFVMKLPLERGASSRSSP